MVGCPPRTLVEQKQGQPSMQVTTNKGVWQAAEQWLFKVDLRDSHNDLPVQGIGSWRQFALSSSASGQPMFFFMPQEHL